MGIFVVVFIVLVIMDIFEFYKESVSDYKVKDIYSLFLFCYFVLGIVVIFVYVGVEVGIFNFINLFLIILFDVVGVKGFGMDIVMVGLIVGIYWFLMMIGCLCGGVLGVKFLSKI